jgi:hypothetical protein
VDGGGFVDIPGFPQPPAGKIDFTSVFDINSATSACRRRHASSRIPNSFVISIESLPIPPKLNSRQSTHPAIQIPLLALPAPAHFSGGNEAGALPARPTGLNLPLPRYMAELFDNAFWQLI